MNNIKRGLPLLICLSVLIGMMSICFGDTSAKAATFDDINQSSVFIKGSSGRCTLASAVMMVRRTAMATGNSNWANITESSMKSTAWIDGQGLRRSFSYNGISVQHANLSDNTDNATELIEILKNHPEGIVLYNEDHPHAILLTDYTNGIFYCADPDLGPSKGRIPISEAYKQKVTINNADRYWYVSSPKITLLGHTHSYQLTSSANATCTSRGYKTYTCSCTDSYTEYTSALGHNYSTFSHYEDAHPHYAVYKCNRCEATSVNRSEFSPYDECVACEPTRAKDLVVTPGTSSTETVITWDPRPVLVEQAPDCEYEFILTIYNSDGKYVHTSETPCDLFNIRPSISVILPKGSYTAELYTVKNKDNVSNPLKASFYVSQGATYTLSYNANGGSGAPSSQSGGSTYTVSYTTPTRSGYTFLGWSTSSSATYATYDAGDTITLTSNTTLYAVWEKNYTGAKVKCGSCGAMFDDDEALHYHIMECTGGVTYPSITYSYCSICGERFESEKECDEHEVTCGQVKCTDCGEIFANETEYNAHLTDCGAQNAGDNSSTGIFGMIFSFFTKILSAILTALTLPFILLF